MAGRFTVETVFRGTDQTSGVIDKIQARTKAMTKGLEGPVGFADKGIDGFKKLGAVAAAAGIGAAFGLEHVVETGADFEHAITGVGAVMGKSRVEVKELEDAALKLGVSTQFSASQVAEAMEQMARKGFDTEEILGGIPGVLDAIAASGEGMAEVSTIVGSSIRAFGLQADAASHVADVLAFSSERVGVKITDMGVALATAAPTAHALGVSIEDTAAAVGLLQKMGIDASTSGTAVATMLAKISHPSHEAAQQMTALGVKFQDARGDMLPFRDVLGQFVHAGDKVGGNMKRMAFFAELVGLRGDKAALGLSAMAKSGDFDKLAAGLRNVDGYAHKVATLRLDDTKGSWKLLTSTVEVLETKLFQLNQGGLKEAIDKTNAWLTANQDLIISGASGFVQELTEDAQLLADNIGLGVDLISDFKDGVVDAFGDNKKIKLFGDVLGGIFGVDSEDGPREKAYELGHAIVDLTSDMATFIFVTKGLEGVIWGIENATKIAKAVGWMWDLGSATRDTLKAIRLAGEIGPANMLSLSNAINGVGDGFGSAANSAGKFAGLRSVLNDTFDGWAGKAGLAAAAIYSIYKAYEQAKAFGDENGGWEGFKGFLGLSDYSNNYGFQGINDVLDMQARDRQAQTEAGRVHFDETVQGAPLARAYDRVGAAFGGPPTPAPPGNYAAAFGVQAAPQVVSSRDGAGQGAVSDRLQKSIDALTQKIESSAGSLKIILPKDAKAEKTGAPGVEVTSTGGF